MADDNPYAAPDANPPEPESGRLLMYSVATVLACGAIGAIAGSAIGVGLAQIAPDYYRVVFSSPNAATANPTSLGLGLGLTEGTVIGVGIGIIVVALHYWYLSRLPRKSGSG